MSVAAIAATLFYFKGLNVLRLIAVFNRFSG